MATLVDTSVLIDLAVLDPVWLQWSRSRLKSARMHSAVIINQIIYSEFSMRYDALDEVDGALLEDAFIRESLPGRQLSPHQKRSCVIVAWVTRATRSCRIS